MNLGLGLGLGSAIAGGGAAAPMVLITPDQRSSGTTYRRYFRGPITTYQRHYMDVITDSAEISPYESSYGEIRGNGATACVTGHGDSLTHGFGGESYINKLVRKRWRDGGESIDYKNRGVPGVSYNYAYADQVSLISDGAHVDAVLANGKTNWLVIWAGTNGIALQGNSAAAELTHATTYIDARIAAGWTADRIVVATMLPRGSGGSLVNETTRSTYNAGLVALASSKGSRLAALHSDALIGAGGSQSNATYYVDTIHLTDAGQKIAMGIIYGTIWP